MSGGKQECLGGPWLDVRLKWQWMAAILSERVSPRSIHPQGTHEMAANEDFPSGVIGFPSSSKHLEISNVARVRAIVKNTIRRAKCLPGQILQHPSVNRGHVRLPFDVIESYLLPHPNTPISSGSLMSGLIWPSLRNRSGLKVCGSG